MYFIETKLKQKRNKINKSKSKRKENKQKKGKEEAPLPAGPWPRWPSGPAKLPSRPPHGLYGLTHLTLTRSTLSLNPPPLPLSPHPRRHMHARTLNGAGARHPSCRSPEAAASRRRPLGLLASPLPRATPAWGRPEVTGALDTARRSPSLEPAQRRRRPDCLPGVLYVVASSPAPAVPINLPEHRCLDPTAPW